MLVFLLFFPLNKVWWIQTVRLSSGRWGGLLLFSPHLDLPQKCVDVLIRSKDVLIWSLFQRRLRYLTVSFFREGQVNALSLQPNSPFLSRHCSTDTPSISNAWFCDTCSIITHTHHNPQQSGFLGQKPPAATSPSAHLLATLHTYSPPSTACHLQSLPGPEIWGSRVGKERLVW